MGFVINMYKYIYIVFIHIAYFKIRNIKKNQTLQSWYQSWSILGDHGVGGHLRLI